MKTGDTDIVILKTKTSMNREKITLLVLKEVFNER